MHTRTHASTYTHADIHVPCALLSKLVAGAVQAASEVRSCTRRLKEIRLGMHRQTPLSAERLWTRTRKQSKLRKKMKMMRNCSPKKCLKSHCLQVTDRKLRQWNGRNKQFKQQNSDSNKGLLVLCLSATKLSCIIILNQATLGMPMSKKFKVFSIQTIINPHRHTDSFLGCL